MRKVVWCQYGLMAAGWALAIAAWPRRAADLNGFLGWNGTLNTPALVQFLFAQPRTILTPPRNPLLPADHPPALHLAWLAIILAGFAVFLFAPMMVRRQNLWRAPGRWTLRLLALPLLAFPLTLLAPPDWHLPRPMTGMYLLAAAHVLVFAALLLTPSPPSAKETAFPSQHKAQ